MELIHGLWISNKSKWFPGVWGRVKSEENPLPMEGCKILVNNASNN